ncbi:hypothetical protein C8R46DRAFT_1026872 [Mycena filopes]|nr:hypothetical protein C8R46DRAFT_1026872 [Mycena filopes]
MLHFLTLILCVAAHLTGATLQSLANITYTNANGSLDRVPSRYATNVTVNGQVFKVEIDTGSSDSWYGSEQIKPSQNLSFNETGVDVVFTYGGGNVYGTIGFASVQLGAYPSDNQIFGNATTIGIGKITEVHHQSAATSHADGAATSQTSGAAGVRT